MYFGLSRLPSGDAAAVVRRSSRPVPARWRSGALVASRINSSLVDGSDSRKLGGTGCSATALPLGAADQLASVSNRVSGSRAAGTAATVLSRTFFIRAHCHGDLNGATEPAGQRVGDRRAHSRLDHVADVRVRNGDQRGVVDDPAEPGQPEVGPLLSGAEGFGNLFGGRGPHRREVGCVGHWWPLHKLSTACVSLISMHGWAFCRYLQRVCTVPVVLGRRAP